MIEVRSLEAGYGGTQVLDDIDLPVRPGQCVALLGESGSGKTTLSRCISGLHSDFSGEVLPDGEPLAASSSKRTREQRRRIQYIFQNGRIVELGTVADVFADPRHPYTRSLTATPNFQLSDRLQAPAGAPTTRSEAL